MPWLLPGFAVILMIGFGVAANLAANVLGGMGPGVGSSASTTTRARPRALFMSTHFKRSSRCSEAEELMFRLFGLTIAWRLTVKAWLGVIAGALLFAAYHYTPLDGLYRTFWQFPIGALVSNLLVAGAWEAPYVKRGLKTAIVGHTLLDGITFVAFVR